jgi:hypothetical protein
MVKLGTNFLKSKEIKTRIKTKFEDMETYIPLGWHNYLKRRYGNYMQLPPIEKQMGHHANNNYMQLTLVENKNENTNLADPFTPCNHKEILQWKTKGFVSNLQNSL